MPDEDVLLKIPELRRRLSCSRSTAYSLLASGVLPTVRLGRGLRVPQSAVDALTRAGGVRVIPKAEPGNDGRMPKGGREGSA